MTFDWTITAGSLLSFVGFIGTILVVYWHAAAKLSKMETKLNIMFTWFQKAIIEKNGSDIARFFGERGD